MNRFKVPKIVRPLRLEEYQPEYGEATIWVWVNPPVELLQQRQATVRRILEAQRELVSALQEMQKEKISAEEKAAQEAQRQACVQRISEGGEETMRWISQVWSQHSDEANHWPLEEVEALVSETAGENGNDPGLWSWLVQHTVEMIGEYRKSRKKA
jgi:hypothetical protein